MYGEALFRNLYDEILPIDADRVRCLDDGEVLNLGTREFRVRHSRGHAEHHFCLFDTLSQSWFSGDMFGISYPPLRLSGGAFVLPATTPTQFDPALYAESVNALADARPRQCYLTHFGALPFASEHAAMLCRQLEAYAALAENSAASHSELADAVTEIARCELARLTDDGRARQLAMSLAMDAQLNAQGIAWWRDTGKRERAGVDDSRDRTG